MTSQHAASTPQRLSGRTVIVTGAGTGIGQGMAVALAKEGANIVIVGRSMAPLEETRAKAEATRAKVHIVQGSVSDAGTASRTVAETIEKFGRIDGLINNAHSFTPNLPLDQTSEADLRM